MRRISVAVSLACLVALISSSFAGVAGAAPSRPGNRVAGAYIVTYRPSVGDVRATTHRLEAQGGFHARFRYSHAIKGFSARLNDRQVSALERNRAVLAVTPDRTVSAYATVPLAAGDVAPTGVSRIEAATSTSTHEASSANVAVLDSGIDLDHPDLNAAHGTNCVGTGVAEDDDGHGTHVAGTIAAKNNGSGVTGVAPGTRVYAAKVLDSTGSGSWSQIICAIDWATATRTDADATNDIAVANMSLGGVGSRVATCATTTDPLHKAICNSTAAGVTYVVAAGNSGWDFDYAAQPDLPAAYPEVLTVTAVSDSDGRSGATGGAPACATKEKDDSFASFSNFAATSAGSAHTVAAPGTCINSTAMNGGYETMSGTSMATPHVAGAVALCIAEAGVAGPCAGLSPAQIIQKMRSDAAAHTTADAAYGFSGDPTRPLSGRYYGYLSWVGTSADATPSPEPTPTPTEPTTPTTVTAAPNSVTIQSGSLRAGTLAALSIDDGSYLDVNSTRSSTYTSSWYGTFNGVANSLNGLEMTYSGKNSRSCSQTVSVWRWTTSSWVQLDARTVGTTEVQVVKAPTGALADYVSGSSGDGDVRVQVRCRTTSGRFFASGDALRIAYSTP